MQPRIEILKEKKLIGCNQEMNLVTDKTGQLWSRFGPMIKEIEGRVSNDKISMQIYDLEYFYKFNPQKNFTKWATVQVESHNRIPTGLTAFTLHEGLYAVFEYIGSSSDNSIFEYIFYKWLPNSSFKIDDRPHFEVLGEKYLNNDPHSEEEIWIPIIAK